MHLEKSRLLPPLDDVRRWAVVIFLVSVAVRVGYALLDSGRLWEPVIVEAFNIARSLARKGEFADAFMEGSGPTAHTTPVYPLVMSGFLRLFGEGAAGYVAIRMLTIASASLCYALLPLLAGTFGFPAAAGVVGGLIGALVPYGRVETEAYFENVPVTALFLGFWLLLEKRAEPRGGSHKTWLLAGCAAGFIMLSGSSFILATALVCLRAWHLYSPRRKGLHLAALACGAALVIFPWVLRNYMTFDRLIPFRSNFWLEMAVSNQDGASPVLEVNAFRGLFRKVHPSNKPAERELYRSVGEVEYMALKKKQAVQWISSHKWEFMRLSLQRVFAFWFYHREYLLITVLIWAMMAVSVFGFFCGLKDRLQWQKRLFMVLLLASIGAIYVLVEVSMRYRYPVHILSLICLGNAVLALAGRAAAAAVWRPTGKI